MNYEITQTIEITVLIILLLGILLYNLLHEDKARVFSPVVFLCGYYIFYIAIPYFSHAAGFYNWTPVNNATKLILATIVTLISFLLGYYLFGNRAGFKRTIMIYQKANVLKISWGLTIIALLSYIITSGLNFNFIGSEEYEAFDENASYGHTDMYISYLLALLPAACSIFFVKKKYLIAILVTCIAVILSLMGGFRYRLLILVICLFVVLHLYPKISRIRWLIWIPIFIFFYYSMKFIEQTRHYGFGLDKERITEVQSGYQSAESVENQVVYELSANVMDTYTSEDFIHFEPIITTIFMPIPRALFPEKPKGLYMRVANKRILGTVEYGGAFVNIVEGYISFGWLGVILYGFLLGFLSRLFWNVYSLNRHSLGAVLLLGLYNGILFIIVSRGYMAQWVTQFVYYVLIFSWLSQLLGLWSLHRR